MSVQAEDARDEAKTALYKEITKAAGEAAEKPLGMRIDLLQSLAAAYGHITYGHGR